MNYIWTGERDSLHRYADFGLPSDGYTGVLVCWIIRFEVVRSFKKSTISVFQ